MGLIKEPLEVDFIVDSRPLTKDEEIALSGYIKTDKEKRALLSRETKIHLLDKVKRTEKI